MNKVNNNLDQLSFDPEPVNWSARRQAGRIRGIKGTFSMMARANKSEGLRHLSDSNPKAIAIDEAYAQPLADGQLYQAGRDVIIERANGFRETAEKRLAEVCMNLCDVRACPLRGNFSEFEKKYHYSPARKALLKKLAKDPKTPC